MRLLRLLIAPTIALTACFYTGTINGRPAAELTPVGPPPIRGGSFAVAVHAEDPDGDEVTVTLLARACNATGSECAEVPYDTEQLSTSDQRTITFDVPMQWELRGQLQPTGAVRVVAAAADVHGVPLLVEQSLFVAVANAVPRIDTQIQGHLRGGGYPAEVPITVAASVTDADDPAAALAATWTLYSPRNSDPNRVVFAAIDGDISDGRIAHRLVPDIEGEWVVDLTVTDPVGPVVSRTTLAVLPDQPPCIGTTAPAAPPVGQTIPLTESRRFAVLVVEDDLDLFPEPPAGDPYFGSAAFAWSIASPATGGAFTPLAGASSNSFEVSPSQFAPGDRIELRVEIADRRNLWPACPPQQPTCGTETCTQRRTWALEVR